jgi:hypothetical protein
LNEKRRGPQEGGHEIERHYGEARHMINHSKEKKERRGRERRQKKRGQQHQDNTDDTLYE